VRTESAPKVVRRTEYVPKLLGRVLSMHRRNYYYDTFFFFKKTNITIYKEIQNEEQRNSHAFATLHINIGLQRPCIALMH